ncbi:MAG: TolC family protein [Sedimentisphaerales bacterium]|nr:TolC family protein [Sedimentisphaerales bacterium]
MDEADEEAYKIIETKWQDSFGQMANYKIRDTVPSEEEIAEAIPSSGIISLEQAVAIATQFNRDYQSRRESLYLSALDLSLTRHDYAKQWFGTFDAEYLNSGGSENNTLSSEVGVDQAFITAGGIIANAGLSIDWTRFLSGDPYSTLGSVLNANVTAPLLGRGGGKTAWENLTQAERNVLYEIRSFNRYRKEFVVSIISEYYRVLEQMKNLEVNRASYERQIDTTKQLKMQVEVGQLAPSEVFEAEQELLRAENSVVSAEQSYAQTLDSFKITLSLPTDANIKLDPNELVALGNVGVELPEYTVEDSVKMALERRLDLANTRDRLDDSGRKLVLAAEGLGVQLNLIGSASVDSTEKTDFTRLRFHEGTYSLGFEADLPFDQKSERNAYREALISLQQRQRGYEEEVERAKLDVRQEYRRLVETTESYRIQKMGVELARKRVEEQRLLLEAGRGIIRLLVDSENALVRAENDLTGALVDHVTAKMSFFRDTGILAVKPDGMWEQRTQ